MNKCDFSYFHYEETLKKIKETHRFSDFFNCNKKDVILRHDVDVSLRSALKIAQIENKLEIESTFFILFHAELYNPFNVDSLKIIKEIVKLDHKIGLHYNGGFYTQNNLEPSESIKKELELMEQHFDTPVRVISAHDPGVSKQFILHLPKGVLNAYSDEFIKNRKYVSDSVQNWREDCFCQNFSKYDEMQILTHPIWWTENSLERNQVLHNLNMESASYCKKEIQYLSDKYENYTFQLK